jgi:hypothetical protein
MGNTASRRILSYERVMRGAFFPQPDPKMPQKEMGEHAAEDMMREHSRFLNVRIALKTSPAGTK